MAKHINPFMGHVCDTYVSLLMQFKHRDHERQLFMSQFRMRMVRLVVIYRGGRGVIHVLDYERVEKLSMVRTRFPGGVGSGDYHYENVQRKLHRYEERSDTVCKTIEEALKLCDEIYSKN